MTVYVVTVNTPCAYSNDDIRIVYAGTIIVDAKTAARNHQNRRNDVNIQQWVDGENTYNDIDFIYN